MDSPIVLFDLFAKSVLVLLVAIGLAALFRSRSAAQQHAWWLATFAALLLLPATKWLSPRWHLPMLGVSSSFAASESGDIAATTKSVPPLLTGTLSLGSKGSWTGMPAGFWLSGVWFVGVGFVVGYRLLGSWQIVSLKSRSPLCCDSRVKELASRAGKEIGLTKSYEIRLHPVECTPCTWGAWRPVVLLPALALGWNRDKLLAVLRHELGHIQRRDSLTNGLVQLGCALYWPNPLVWLAARRLRLAQEQACDDLALRAGSEVSDYAALILETAHRYARAGVCTGYTIAMARPSALEGRISAIVDPTRNRHPAGIWTTLAGILLVLAVVTASALGQIAPESAGPRAGAESASAPQPSQVVPRAAKLMIPQFSCADLEVKYAVRFLESKSQKAGARHEGVPILLDLSLPEQEQLPRLTMDLRQMTLFEMIWNVATAANLKLQAEGGVLMLRKPGQTSESPRDRFLRYAHGFKRRRSSRRKGKFIQRGGSTMTRSAAWKRCPSTGSGPL